MDRYNMPVGTTCRIFGYPGTWEYLGFHDKIDNRERHMFRKWQSETRDLEIPFLLESVVEINGEPVPMLSCPIAYPALDYPHKPLFDYNDGPKENAAEAVKFWEERRELLKGKNATVETH